MVLLQGAPAVGPWEWGQGSLGNFLLSHKISLSEPRSFSPRGCFSSCCSLCLWPAVPGGGALSDSQMDDSTQVALGWGIRGPVPISTSSLAFDP